MPDSLPPDLSRLGDELARATAARAAADRRRARSRRRLAVTAAATVLGFVALAPGTLQRGDGAGPVRLAAAAVAGYHPTACDSPRGATFAAARPCASPGATDAEPSTLARRLAEN
jgi:hypothetical protein